MRKRLLAAIMAMMLTFTLVPATGAAEGKPADRIMNNAYRSKGDFEPSALRKPMGAVRAGALPSSYSSVEQGYLTQVKDQNPYGTCWTFAALAASEADAIKNEGADASNLDLSELHLAYFSYSKKTDPLGGLDGDAVRVTMGDFLNIGGNNNIAINTLANWTGAADESIAPYGTTSTTMTIDEKVRFLDKYHLRNAYVYALPNDADAVKQAVMKYGAAATSIWYDMSNGYNGQYLYQNAKTIENHAVTIVGWDDTISKTLFNPDQPENQPKNNGAWLVRNSWGSSANDGGYFWLSYEDTSIHSAAIYDVQAAGTYDRNYQYDGGIYSFYYNGIDAASNIFTAKYSETLKAIGVTVAGKTNTPYDVKIYKKPKNGEPDSGTLVSQASGLFNSNGFYTIDLNQDVELMPGDRFSVVISTQADVYADNMDSGSNVSWFSSQTTAYEGQSYFKYDGSWRPSPT